MNDEEIKQKVEKVYRLEGESDIAFERDDFAGASSLSREAEQLQSELEAAGIELCQHGNEEESLLSKDDKPYLIFDYANWTWRKTS